MLIPTLAIFFPVYIAAGKFMGNHVPGISFWIIIKFVWVYFANE